MGNQSSSMEEEQTQQEYINNSVERGGKPEKKRRKAKNKTSKRKLESLEDFGIFDEEQHSGPATSMSSYLGDNDVIEQITIDTERPMPKRKKRRNGVSRKRDAWSYDN
jgi:hypothetical protein